MQSSSSVEGSPDRFANLHLGLDEDMLVPSVAAAPTFTAAAFATGTDQLGAASSSRTEGLLKA